MMNGSIREPKLEISISVSLCALLLTVVCVHACLTVGGGQWSSQQTDWKTDFLEMLTQKQILSSFSFSGYTTV